MPKRISEIKDSLRQLGEIQVTDWDFMGLLNKDIKDLEIGRSLRKLGNRKVIDWDFRTVAPTIHKLAHQEVDLVDLVKRAARYKVIDWDFRTALSGDDPPRPEALAEPAGRHPNGDEMQALMDRLRNFLEFVVASLIDEADQARIVVEEIEPGVLRFNLVVTQRDLTGLIGRNGFTASAIRNLLKASAAMDGVSALLQIQSHEDQRHRAKAGG